MSEPERAVVDEDLRPDRRDEAVEAARPETVLETAEAQEMGRIVHACAGRVDGDATLNLRS